MSGGKRVPEFPSPESANADGLVAWGGRLDPEWLIAAYRKGIFPWFDSDDSAILWWSPDPRAAVRPGAVRITRSLAKAIRNRPFAVSMDQDFPATIHGCATRGDRAGSSSWITPRMQAAYHRLFDLGLVHTVEVRAEGELVGGLYGVSLGDLFFGESMFSIRTDASKVAFVALHIQLRRWHFRLIDCQLPNPHLDSLGVTTMPRRIFLEHLQAGQSVRDHAGRWHLDPDWRDDLLELMRVAPSDCR